MRTRLTYPHRFRSERAAIGYIRDEGLFSIGAVAVRVDDTGLGWRIAIDSARPDAVVRYLGQRLPGREWQRTESPA